MYLVGERVVQMAGIVKYDNISDDDDIEDFAAENLNDCDDVDGFGAPSLLNGE